MSACYSRETLPCCLINSQRCPPSVLLPLLSRLHHHLMFPPCSSFLPIIVSGSQMALCPDRLIFWLHFSTAWCLHAGGRKSLSREMERQSQREREFAHSLFSIGRMSQKGLWAISILITLMGNPCQHYADDLPSMCEKIICQSDVRNLSVFPHELCWKQIIALQD